MTTTALYRFYDDKATLLYVGITNNLPARLGEHARDKAYSWLGAHFGYDTRLVPWDDIVDLCWGHAIERADDAVVYDMDPLADFQDEWHAA